MSITATAMQAVRRRAHPIHLLKQSAVLRNLAASLDFEVWAQLYRVRHPVRLRVWRNFSYLLDHGKTEPAVLALMLALNACCRLRRFWDVGANVGYYTWLLSSENPALECVCIEPDPVNAQLLRQTLARTQANVQIVNCAASDHAGQAVFQLDVLSGATGTLETGVPFVKRHYGMASPSTIVNVLPIDSLASGSPVDLIKIDVEGHETKVFSGAASVLRRDRPVLIFETFARPQSLFSFLTDLNYIVLGVDRMTHADDGESNFLALPERYAANLDAIRERWARALVAK